MTPDTVDYIARSALWAIAGFVGGFLIGRATRDVHRIAVAVTTPPGDRPVPARRPHRRPTVQFIVGLVVVLLALATVILGLVATSGIRRVVNCNQAYANAMGAALDARSAANNDAQTALDTLVNAIAAVEGQPTADRQYQVRQAISAYIAARNRAKATLITHPLPPTPHEVCP